MTPTAERVMQILSQLPARQPNGLFAPNADVQIANVLAVLLMEYGIYGYYPIGQNLSKIGLPSDLPIR